MRVGEVGMELAQMLTEQGNLSAAREALSKPHLGFTFSKTF